MVSLRNTVLKLVKFRKSINALTNKHTQINSRKLNLSVFKLTELYSAECESKNVRTTKKSDVKRRRVPLIAGGSVKRGSLFSLLIRPSNSLQPHEERFSWKCPRECSGAKKFGEKLLEMVSCRGTATIPVRVSTVRVNSGLINYLILFILNYFGKFRIFLKDEKSQIQ